MIYYMNVRGLCPNCNEFIGWTDGPPHACRGYPLTYFRSEGRNSFSVLREAILHRQKQWDSSNMLDIAYRGNELAGEVGEACNIIKKIERERRGLRGNRATMEQLIDELADIIICVDLIAGPEGIDLWNAVRKKFNETSEKNGFDTRIE